MESSLRKKLMPWICTKIFLKWAVSPAQIMPILMKRSALTSAMILESLSPQMNGKISSVTPIYQDTMDVSTLSWLSLIWRLKLLHRSFRTCVDLLKVWSMTRAKIIALLTTLEVTKTDGSKPQKKISIRDAKRKKKTNVNF